MPERRRLSDTLYSGVARASARSYLLNIGFTSEDLQKPIVGVNHAWVGTMPCNFNHRQLAAWAAEGVRGAGGTPMEVNTISISDGITMGTAGMKTSLVSRELVCDSVELVARGHYFDALCCISGCDKTVPAMAMAAARLDRPAVVVYSGSILAGRYRGREIAVGDLFEAIGATTAGRMTETDLAEMERSACPGPGACGGQYTANTMSMVLEALGLSPVGYNGLTAVDPARESATRDLGALVLKVYEEDLRPSRILTRAAFENAIAAVAASGGSTNAVLHLIALAAEVGVELTVDDFDRICRQVPLLVDCKPTGSGYMEDVHRAGGLPVLLKALEPLLDLSALRCDGRSLAQSVAEATTPPAWQHTIAGLDHAIGPPGALAVVRGSLAPNGAVLKVAAATPSLLQHRGPALVFDCPEDVERRIDDPDLPVTPETVLVLRNSGPRAAGMPEAGSFPIPRRLGQAGVRDMVRISDARMSGTAYGTVILHCAPESAAGGPLALVRDGDMVELDTEARRLDLLVDEADLRGRREALRPPVAPARGWERLFFDHVQGADLGCDLDFLRGREPG